MGMKIRTRLRTIKAEVSICGLLVIIINMSYCMHLGNIKFYIFSSEVFLLYFTVLQSNYKQNRNMLKKFPFCSLLSFICTEYTPKPLVLKIWFHFLKMFDALLFRILHTSKWLFFCITKFNGYNFYTIPVRYKL